MSSSDVNWQNTGLTAWHKYRVGWFPKRIEGQWIRNQWVHRRQVSYQVNEEIIHPDDPGMTTSHYRWEFRLIPGYQSGSEECNKVMAWLFYKAYGALCLDVVTAKAFTRQELDYVEKFRDNMLDEYHRYLGDGCIDMSQVPAAIQKVRLEYYAQPYKKPMNPCY